MDNVSTVNYKTEVFEGPLDLLLTLIAKKKVSILEVSLLEIIEQYLAYMETMDQNDIDYTGEFIVMAAKLLYIKSWILLPHEEEKEEEENPEEELRARLIEYAQFKEASTWLEDASFASRYLFYHKPESLDLKELPPLNSVMNPNRLLKAFQKLLEAKEEEIELLPTAFSPIIGKPRASVSKSTKNVLSKLKKNKKMTFEALFVSLETRTEKIATFLAILTLIKQGRMMITFTEKEIICEGVMQNAD